MTTSNTNGTILPSEVGWQFVPQYYTFVNKDPSRLHCFYTKTSTFSHGTEGEEIKPCHGQQEIHAKITSIGFQDCKVFIHSVDAQASYGGGIIIQVIGEMSNHGEPWRKFVQTFFLAEQPNGYFVLNDIFRFLKEDAVEEGDEGLAEADAVEQPTVTLAPAPEPAPAPVASSPVPPPAAAVEPIPEPPRSPSPPPQPSVAAPPPPPPVEEEKAEEVPEPEPEVSEPAPAQQPNGDGAHAPEPEKPAVGAPPPAAAPAPAPQVAAPPPQQAPPAAAPAPAAPRTWATLAASNARKWGSAVSTDARGVTETPSPVVSATPSRTQTPPVQRQVSQSGGQQGGAAAAQSVNHPSCFVKGVTEPVTQTLLTNTLTQRFGPVKDVEIVRSKACAFLEFLTVDAARKAIVASLPQSQGGEGGIWIETGGEGGRVRISVETKKERGDRPPVRGGRGGAVPGGQANGDGRGGFRGRGGGQGARGRGGQVGGK